MYRLVRNPHNPVVQSSNTYCWIILATITSIVFMIFLFCLGPSLIPSEYSLRLSQMMQVTDDDELSAAFAEFITQYDRSYETSEEFVTRRQVFASNYRKIQEFNSRPSRSYTLGVNQFADLTEEEFASQFLTSPRPSRPSSPSPIVHGTIDPTINVNWVAEGKVSRVKDQGNCGSCWTFSVATVVETIYAIKEKKDPPRFSEQNLVDCCRGPLSQGCGGGEPTDAFNYIKEHGIAYDKDYPYVARDEACRQNSVHPAFFIEGYQNITYGSNSEMEAAIKTRTMVIAVSASPFAFRFYKQGIIDSGCPDDLLNHDVAVVGAMTENGMPYWLVRNSWGPNWGMNGYVKIMRTEDGARSVCGVTTYPQYVIYKDGSAQ